MQNPAYTPVAQWLHWLVAGMIVLQYVLADAADQAAQQSATLQQLALLAQHKSLGITILLLALLRLVWRWRYPPPALPQTMPRWQQHAAHAGHWALYTLLICLPFSGWLMSSASAYSVSWFNLIQLPDFVDPSDSLKAQLLTLHEVLAKALFVIALVHIGAAIKHHLIDRDGGLQRMVSVPAIAVAVVLIVWGLPNDETQAPKQNNSERTAQATTSDNVDATPAQVQLNSTLPQWRINHAASHIQFTGIQAGAPFAGSWTDWQADIQFDPANLDASRATVLINPAKVETNDAERDRTISGPEFFDTDNFPQVLFNASAFTRQNDGSFVTAGLLTIKQVQLPVRFEFVVHVQTANNETAITLEGTTQVDRLLFTIGTGDWQDTTWVGQFVDVHVKVTANI